MKTNQILWLSIILSLGMITAGYFIGNTLVKSKMHDRSVTVKGLAEREVDANLAVWPISFSETSNELSEIQAQLDKKTEIIYNFLVNQGFSQEEIANGIPTINDVFADRYAARDQFNTFRYIGNSNMTVRTKDIKKLNNAIANISKLIGQGIVLNQNNYWQTVEYLYTDLNVIKPEMIEEATKNAREAAEKFAQDSGSKVGKIKNASQGLFTITNRDINSPHIKNVRIVTTIEYYLND